MGVVAADRPRAIGQRNRRIVVVVVVVSAIVASVAGLTEGRDTAGVRPVLAADQDGTTDRDLRRVADAVLDAAVDLHRQVGPANTNLVLSPDSVATALAMTYAGARGSTALQIAKVMHLTLPPAALSAVMAALSGRLTAANDGRDLGGGIRAALVTVANSVWGDADSVFRADFVELLAQRYGAAFGSLAFRGDPETARRTINTWIAERTLGLGGEMVGPDLVDADTRLVLVSAASMKAGWAAPFPLGATSDAPFHPASGPPIPVPTMVRTQEAGYAEGRDYQAVELPYASTSPRPISMIAIRPRRTSLSDFEKGLDGGRARRILDAVDAGEPADVHVRLPRFKIQTSAALGPVLRSLGMRAAFDPYRADLSGMSNDERLFVGGIMHKADISVDENGTVATAATAVAVQSVVGRPALRSVTVSFDVPFLFLVVDRLSGMPLFIGRVADPRG